MASSQLTQELADRVRVPKVVEDFGKSRKLISTLQVVLKMRASKKVEGETMRKDCVDQTFDGLIIATCGAASRASASRTLFGSAGPKAQAVSAPLDLWLMALQSYLRLGRWEVR